MSKNWSFHNFVSYTHCFLFKLDTFFLNFVCLTLGLILIVFCRKTTYDSYKHCFLFKLGPLKFQTRAPRPRETQHHRGRDRRTLKPIASQNYHQEQDQEVDIHFIQERQLKLWKYE